MSILNVKATIQCDGCNEQFTVDLDRAKMLTVSIDDYVWEIVADSNGAMVGPSVQGSHLLCEKCTKFIDNVYDDDDNPPTYDQVAAALNKRAGV